MPALSVVKSTQMYMLQIVQSSLIFLTWMSDINYISNSAYEKYSFDVIPVMGQIIAGDWKSYKYLVESIRQFPNQVCPIKFVEHFTCITK